MPLHGSRLVIAPEFVPFFRAQGIDRVADVAARWQPGSPPGELSRVTEHRLPHAGGPLHFFLKTYHYPGAARLRTLFIPSRVRREYENLLGLGRLGLNVPRPIAYGETRRFGLLVESFLATEAVAPAIDLRDFADDPERCPFPPPGRPERRAIVVSFARSLRRCHDEGWHLHTAFFKNLLLTRGPAGCALYVIDVPFARIWRNRLLPGRARVRDFATLLKGAMRLLGRTERMRFAKAYGADKRLLREAEAYYERNYAKEPLTVDR